MSGIMLRAITRFTLERNPVHLRSVNIVIFDKPVFAAFKKHMSSELRGSGSGMLAALFSKYTR